MPAKIVEIAQREGIDASAVDVRLIAQLVCWVKSGALLAPLCSAVGAFAAHEAIKAVTGMGTPLNQLVWPFSLYFLFYFAILISSGNQS